MTSASVATLSSGEAARLFRLEQVIETGKQTFLRVGQALLEIRDSRLYRDTHGTFEAYCAERWEISRPRAYQMIDAAGVAKAVAPVSTDVDTPVIRSEAVARELAPVLRQNGAETARQVWQDAVTEHGDKPTAAQVREIAKRTTTATPIPAADPLGPKPSSDNDPEYRWLKLVHGLVSLANSIRDLDGLPALTATWDTRTRDQFLAELDYLIQTLQHVKQEAAA